MRLKSISLSILATFIGITFSNKALGEISREDKESLVEIMHQQEEVLGIKYNGEPKVEWSFDNLKRDFPVKLWAMFHAAALYDEMTNTIFIDQDKCNFSVRHILVKELYGFDPCLNPKQNLAHELGHYYVDQLHEAITGKDYIPESRIKRMLGEGIAVYFETIIIPRKIECDNLSYWLKSKDIYTAGYCLVKPILDEFKGIGVEALIRNPITPKELDKPEEYQRRIREWIEDNPN